MNDNWMSVDNGARGSKRQRVLHSDGVFLYEYERGEISRVREICRELRREITFVRIGPQVQEIPSRAFKDFRNLAEVSSKRVNYSSLGREHLKHARRYDK